MAKMGRPKNPNAKKKVLSVRISDELYCQMLEYAEKNDLTTTDVVLRGLVTLLGKENQ